MGRDGQLRELWKYWLEPAEHQENAGTLRDLNHVLSLWHYTDAPDPFPEWFAREAEHFLNDFAFFNDEMKTEASLTILRLYSLNASLTQDLRLDELLGRLGGLDYDARQALLEAAELRQQFGAMTREPGVS